MLHVHLELVMLNAIDDGDESYVKNKKREDQIQSIGCVESSWQQHYSTKPV